MTDAPRLAPEPNLFDVAGLDRGAEQVQPLFSMKSATFERIVSFGQASPPGFWHDQPRAEWVVLLTGSAGVLFEGEPKARALRPGDQLLIPAHKRHRVEWTDAGAPSIWLAVHFEP